MIFLKELTVINVRDKMQYELFLLRVSIIWDKCTNVFVFHNTHLLFGISLNKDKGDGVVIYG